MCRGVACPVHQASLSFLGCLWPCADRIPMPSPLALLGKPAKPCWPAWKLNACARARWIRTGARAAGHAMVSSVFAMRTAEAHQGRRLSTSSPMFALQLSSSPIPSCQSCCEHIGDAERNGVGSLAIRPVNSGIRVAGPCIGVAISSAVICLCMISFSVIRGS